MQEIAKRLGVSLSTVSRALKNHPRISEKTKQEVLKIAKEIEYEPNQLALSLLNKRINAIGVVVPQIKYHLYASAISGIEKAANEAGFNIMICQTNELFEREVSIVKELIASRVAGLIVSVASESRDFAHLEQVLRKGIPLVLFNRDCEQLKVPKVVIDNYTAAFQATEKLIESGCENIAFLAGPPQVQISNKRLTGYKSALRKHHLQIDNDLIIHCEFSQENAANATLKLLRGRQQPDAILAFSDQMAIGAMLSVKEAGLKIPEDISIIGFNNEPVDLLLDPKLSSVDQPGYEMGEIATKLLLDQLEESYEELNPQKKVLATKLVVRESLRF